MNYALHLGVMICLYTILGLSLNLVVGYSGQLSLCHGAFYGIGAYASTILMTKLGMGFLPAMLCSIMVAVFLSSLFSWPALRLRGDFFVLATLGFQMIVFSLLYNWVPLTQGPYGIPGIPKPILLGMQVQRPEEFLALVASAAFLIGLLHWQIARSPYGRALTAVRDDELAAQALGKNPFYFRATAFVLAAGMAAIAGVLYAGYTSYIDPTSFRLDEAIFIITVVIIGGSGNTLGPIIGAVFVVLMPELLRFLQIPGTITPNVRQIVFGLVLILAMRFRPKGLAGRYSFD